MERSVKFDQLYGEEAGPVIDGTPMAIPAGFRRPPTLAEQVQRLVRGALSRQAEDAGFENFDEANDFDVPDDPVDPTTPFEEYFDPVLGRSITPDEFKRYESAYREQYLRAQGNKIAAEDREDAIKAHIAELRALKARKSGAAGGSPSNPPQPPEKSSEPA